MNLLFVGGTGLISAACAALARAQGHELYVVTRGRSLNYPFADGARVIEADAYDPLALRAALERDALGEHFDAVVQFVGYEPGHIVEDVTTFAPRAKQYVFVSTCAAYPPTPRFKAFREDGARGNPLWEYAALKAECEAELRVYAEAADIPVTIVRPAHTYGPSKIPAYVGNSAHPWTLIDRMRRGADIIVPGDGTSVWTLTHARDLAVGIVGLCGNEAAYGKAVNATSDDVMTWEAIYRTIAVAAGVDAAQHAKQVVHVPTDGIVAADPGAAGGTRGDKMRAMVVNNSRMRSLVHAWQPRTSLADGIRESIAWFEADPARQSIDAGANAMLDRLGSIYRGALTKAGRR